MGDSVEHKSYLDYLKFDPALLRSIPGKYLGNIRLMFLFVLSVIGIGIYSYFTLPRTLNPEVNIPIVIVSTVYPGASPEVVESSVTIPLENAIKRIEGIDTYSSSSQESVGVITVQFTSEIDSNKAKLDVQSAVDEVTDLPEDVQTPTVRVLNFENIPVWSFALIKRDNSADQASLMSISERLKEDLETLSTIDRVELSGFDEEEIVVALNLESLQEKNLNPLQISQAVKSAVSSFPAGTITTGSSLFSLALDPTVTSITELRELPLKVDDQTLKLGEIASISLQAKPDQAPVYYANHVGSSKPAVVFSVYKTDQARVDVSGTELQDKTTSFLNSYGNGYEIRKIQDYSEQINDQFASLFENFGQTLFLVFLSMLLLYGIRQALIASAAIPLALFLVFSSMQSFGISISFISLFSLLIALGLFVDNAVVIIEAYTSYFNTGKFTPLQTALLVWRDFFLELFSINLLTVWAFLPLLITTGIIGEFIFPIPIIVSVSMMGSVAVAMLFTLPSMMLLSQFRVPLRVRWLLLALLAIAILLLAAVLIPKTVLFIPTLLLIVCLTIVLWILRTQLLMSIKANLKNQVVVSQSAGFIRRAFDNGFIDLSWLTERYQALVYRLMSDSRLRKKMLAAVVIMGILSYLLVPLGLVKNEFFPKTDQNQLFVTLELPVGTNKTVTTQTAQSILSELAAIPEVEFVVLEIQQGYSNTVVGGGVGANSALLTVVLQDSQIREKSSIDIAQELREKYKALASAKVQVLEESGGPPAGSDLEISILGESLEELELYASRVENFLAETEGVTNISRSIKGGTSKLAFNVDSEKLVNYGISEQQLGLWLRTLSTGFTLDEVTFEEKDREIILRVQAGLASPEMVQQLQIPTQQGLIPLSEFGSLVLKSNPTQISRENGERKIVVTASALPGYLPTELNVKLENFARDGLNLGAGYTWKVGGQNEENQESINSIVQAMGLSALLILVTMVIQLGSFRKAIIVMLVIPLAVSGVFIWFALTQVPLSFPALVGELALFGIVIANSLMIVSKVNQNLEAGFSTKNAVADAATSRLEPILLTSASQVIGLLPITIADPIWRGFGGAIIAGLSFSGTIMLLFIPIVFIYFYPNGSAVKRNKAVHT